MDKLREVQFISQVKVEQMPHDLRGKGVINKFFIYGDSMEPTIYHGDFIYASYVEGKPGPLGGRWDIMDGYIYIVNSRTHGLILKRLYNKVKSVNLVCDNPDKDAHPLINIDYPDIIELWRVRRKYSAQFPAPTEAYSLGKSEGAVEALRGLRKEIETEKERALKHVEIYKDSPAQAQLWQEFYNGLNLTTTLIDQQTLLLTQNTEK